MSWECAILPGFYESLEVRATHFLPTRVRTIFMRIRLDSPERPKDVPLKYEGIIKIHEQVFAIGLNITFPWLHKPINAEIILLCINTIQ